MQILSAAGLLLLYVATATAQFHQHTHAHTHSGHNHQQQQQQQQQQALFIRNIEEGPSPHHEHNYQSEPTSDRIPRQSKGLSLTSADNMDQTVQGILEWLQGKYVNARKARQEAPARQYLPARPPTTTQKPRPFQTNNGDSFRSFDQGYPYAQSPNPTFNVPETPSPSSTLAPYNPSSSVSPFIPSSTGYNAPSPSPTFNPVSSTYNPSSPSSTFGVSGFDGSPSPIPGLGSSQQPFGSSPESPFSGEPSPSQIPFNPSTGTGFSSTGMGFPSPLGPGVAPTGPSGPGVFPPSPQGVPVDNNIDSDGSAHPPHIHEINVQCAKDMMIIEIEFDRPFDGIIYSKGYYNNPSCRYVSPNSGQSRYQLTVLLNSCGTQFVDQFSEGKQAYLENVLVLQNEPGIQEVGGFPRSRPRLRPVWDTIRSVRCLWEGNLNKALSVALSVGMLTQEIVTFSGDTAIAKLDIQMGRGPFAANANGLVKIGETMTLVVTVEGDPGFNVLVRQCVARDNDPSSGNVVQLTDDRGCVVKPKLMGAFQTTRNPDTNTVIAYAFFQAFKFPDVMDLTIECNVELCKTECAPCSDTNQKYEPGRRRRSVDNSTLDLTDPVTVGRRLRVFLPEDLEQSNQSPAMVINVGGPAGSLDSVCLSSSVFLFSSTLLLAILAASCICCALLWLRMQHQSLRK